MSVLRLILEQVVTPKTLGGLSVGVGLLTALLQNSFLVLVWALVMILIGFVLILESVLGTKDPVRISIVNRTGRQLRIAFNGPGEIGKKNSGTVCGAAPFPPGKVSSLPGDVVSVEVSNRGSRVGSMDSAAEARMAGSWLDDA